MRARTQQPSPQGGAQHVAENRSHKGQGSNPQAVPVSLHPGTVNTGLSKPFKGEQIGRPALEAASDMLMVLSALTPADTGTFVSYAGERLPW